MKSIKKVDMKNNYFKASPPSMNILIHFSFTYRPIPC